MPKGKANNSEATQKKIKNLKKFQKGVSGNPNGRPKGSKNIKNILEDMLEIAANQEYKDELLTIDKNIYNNKDLIIARMIYEAIHGDMNAINSIFDRMIGKPSQSLDVTSKGEAITNQEKLSPEERRQLIEKLRVEISNNNG